MKPHDGELGAQVLIGSLPRRCLIGMACAASLAACSSTPIQDAKALADQAVCFYQSAGSAPLSVGWKVDEPCESGSTQCGPDHVAIVLHHLGREALDIVQVRNVPVSSPKQAALVSRFQPGTWQIVPIADAQRCQVPRSVTVVARLSTWPNTCQDVAWTFELMQPDAMPRGWAIECWHSASK